VDQSNRRTNRRLGILIAGLLAALAIAACNPGNPDGTPVGGAPAAERLAA
jgi:hypothetical protein